MARRSGWPGIATMGGAQPLGVVTTGIQVTGNHDQVDFDHEVGYASLFLRGRDDRRRRFRALALW
jgi:hypothetical protein